MSIANNKLAFEKTTIRSLTDTEINDVAGGTTPFLVASSAPCAEAAAIAAIAAYAAYQRYA